MTKEQEELFQNNIGYAKALSRKFMVRYSIRRDHDDYMQCALIGLYKASIQYKDLGRAKFSTFAFKKINNEMYQQFYHFVKKDGNDDLEYDPKVTGVEDLIDKYELDWDIADTVAKIPKIAPMFGHSEEESYQLQIMFVLLMEGETKEAIKESLGIKQYTFKKLMDTSKKILRPLLIGVS